MDNAPDNVPFSLDWKDYLIHPDSKVGPYDGLYSYKTEIPVCGPWQEDLSKLVAPIEDWRLDSLPQWAPTGLTPSGKIFYFAVYLRYRKIMFPATPTFRLFRGGFVNPERIQEWQEVRDEMFPGSVKTSQASQLFTVYGINIRFNLRYQDFFRTLLLEERAAIPGWEE